MFFCQRCGKCLIVPVHLIRYGKIRLLREVTVFFPAFVSQSFQIFFQLCLVDAVTEIAECRLIIRLSVFLKCHGDLLKIIRQFLRRLLHGKSGYILSEDFYPAPHGFCSHMVCITKQSCNQSRHNHQADDQQDHVYFFCLFLTFHLFFPAFFLSFRH